MNQADDPVVLLRTTAQVQGARFADVLISLYGNRCSSLTLDRAADRLLCESSAVQIDHLREALYANQSLYAVKVSADFLNRLHTKDQEKFLRSLWNIKTLGVVQLGVDDERAKFKMNVLAQSLQNNVPIQDATKFSRLSLKSMVIHSPEEAQDVASGLRGLDRVLSAMTQVTLGPFAIAMPQQQVSDGILDPLVDLLAEMVQTHRQVLHVESYSGKNGPLMSAEAAQRLMSAFRGNETIFQRGLPSVLELTGLGLDDATMAAMTSAIIQFPNHLGEVYLHNNPAISFDSVDLWLRAIDHCPNLTTVQCGVEGWDATVKLHVKLNGFGRRDAIEAGLFSNRSVWCDWLAQLATVERLVQKFHFQRYCRDNDSLVLSALFLTVRNQPNFVQ